MSVLFKKLNLKEQTQILVVNAPVGFEQELAKLANVDIVRALKSDSTCEFILCFTENQQVLNISVPDMVAALSDDGVLWFAYPKKLSKKYQSDISRDHGWQLLGDLGFEGVRQVAIDDDWSALRFRHVDYIKSLKRDPKWIMSAQGQSKIKSK